MPCMTSDGMGDGPSYGDHKRLEERIERLERERIDVSRFLCGICTALTKAYIPGVLEVVLNSVDWSAAGTTRAEFDRWWSAHKRRDGR